MILPDDTEWKEYLEHALMAQFMALPVPSIPKQCEPHPVCDGMGDEE